MRVGYIVPSLDDTTGWGRWCNDLLRHIREEGVDPVIFAPASSRKFMPPDLAGDPSFFVLPELFDYAQSSDGLKRLLGIRALWSADLAAARVDLVHSLDAHPWGIYGDWLARRLGVPHLLTTHGRYGYIAQNRLLDRMLYRRVLTRSAGMIAVSDAVKRAVLRDFSRALPAQRLRVLQNPVDAEQFAVAGDLPDFVPADGPVVISVTRFTPVKDIETLVRAFRLVRLNMPAVPLYVIGPGNGERNAYYRAVRDVVANEQITGVHFVGRVAKDVLAAFYRRASMLVHSARTLPDDFEASGLILLEAGLFGLPVVASASGGIPEVVADGVTGRLVPEGDPRALADAVLQLLGDGELAGKLGASNRERARQRNWSAYGREQMQIYTELLAARRHD
jgi:starch synthase